MPGDVVLTGDAVKELFTGAKGAETLSPRCDYCLAIPSNDTPRIQEAHEFVWHYLCGIIETRLFSHTST